MPNGYYENVEDKKKEVSCMFGVYDGHGGREVSSFVRDNLAKVLMGRVEFGKKKYDRMFEPAYYQIDEMM